jgi:transketolase
MEEGNIDSQCINAIRFLAADAIQEGQFGTPGGCPWGRRRCAAYTLFTRLILNTIRQPRLFDRDRFVLSAGHASMLLYALLHLAGMI